MTTKPTASPVSKYTHVKLTVFIVYLPGWQSEDIFSLHLSRTKQTCPLDSIQMPNFISSVNTTLNFTLLPAHNGLSWLWSQLIFFFNMGTFHHCPTCSKNECLDQLFGLDWRRSWLIVLSPEACLDEWDDLPDLNIRCPTLIALISPQLMTLVRTRL